MLAREEEQKGREVLHGGRAHEKLFNLSATG